MTIGLPISRLITASVSLTPTGATAPNFNSCLVLGTSAIIDTVSRFRNYSSPSAVGTDFGTSAEEYLAASAWFAQSPQPTSLLIGRWCKTAAKGQLVGGAVSAANQVMTVWTAITTGSMRITIDGGSVQNLASLNFSAQTTLNGVATVISTALTGAVVTWDANYKRFVVTSNSTGASSTVSFVSATGSGVDISAMLAMTSTSSGAYQASGVAAETALAAATIFDTNWSDQWYGLVILSAANSDHVAVAGFCQSSTAPHRYGVTTSEAGALTSGDTSNIGYQLKALGYNAIVQYSSSSVYAVVSLLGRILTTNWSANNTAITLMYKNEPGIVAETLNQTQITNLESYNINVFVAYNNNTAIIEPGICSSGQFIDTIIGVDWLKSTLQSDGYGALKASTTKIPQTDGGMHQIATIFEADLAQGVNNGLLAPGVWTGASFGQIKTGDFLPKGFYVYQPPISNQPTADRAARKSVAFQIATCLAGAVHSVNLQINVVS
jgi:hypothetical protein